MANENKSLVIEGPGIACSKADIWDKIDFAKDGFLEKINTGATVSGKEFSINSYVSGVPSPYARVHLLKYALSHARTIRQNPENGINKFYKGLLDQWRVLLTGIALHEPLLDVRRVELVYSDGKEIQDTANPYEAKGAFGNMLLKNRDRWCDPTVAEDKKVPFIDILKYGSGSEKRVVGGLCSETIVFTSTRFDSNSQPELFDEAMHLSDKDKGRLLAYIKHLRNELSNYGNLMNVDTKNIDGELQEWTEELKNGLSEDVNTEDVPNVNIFKHPFNKLLNHTSNFYSDGNGAIFKTMPDVEYIEFDLNEVLLPKDADIAKLRVTPEASKNPSCMQNFPLHLLKAERIGEAGSYDYFALPLTAKGLQVYGSGINGLLSEGGGEIRSTLKASYDPSKSKDNLTVTLEIRFSGDNSEKGAEKQEVYTVNKTMIDKKDIVMWPNFVRDHWNRYYLYSELPHNTQSSDCPFNSVPIAGIPSQGRINMMVDANQNPVLLAKNGLANMEVDNFRPKLLVTATKVLDKPYKYEIYQSNMPYYGVALTSKGKPSGYLVVKYGREGQKQLPRNLWGQALSDVKKASLGFDFGSTNTSVAFRIENDSPMGFAFENRRISLLMNTHSPETDKSGWHESKTAQRNLFFFQRNRVQSNAIKSILSLHDPMRIDLETGAPADSILENAIVGGFPCLEKELPIESVNQRRINLAFDNDTTAELVHNMKWSDNKIDEANRKAFLRSLLLQVYAELYDPIDNNRISAVVDVIRWSYPSSFNFALSQQYNSMWNSVIRDFPFDESYSVPTISAPKFEDGGLGSGLGADLNQSAGMSGLGSGLGMTGGLGGGLTGGLGGGLGASPLSGGLNPMGGGLGSSTVGGLGSQTQSENKPEMVDLRPKNEPIDFNFSQLILGNSSLTEAVAVANNYASRIDMTRLLLCFDIGGSTSDFSAMCSVRNNPALVKQSSIKFAAQNVVKATQFCANKFKDIALEVCKENDWHIPGLNVGDNRFNADSAMFYFDQIADRLDVDKLPGFYKKISTACQPLMITNLYVTGLIMFYAGQITRRLVQDIRNAKGEDANPNFRPQVMLKCAGKGARVFEWLSCVNKELAINYFRYTFLAGIAGTIENDNALEQNAVQFISALYVDELVKGEASNEIKYEVSMGLIRQSSQVLLVPKMDNAIECVGEDNFMTMVSTTKEQAPLKFDDCVTADMYRYLGSYFTCPLRGNYQQFNNFINLFYSYARNFGVESYFQGPEVIEYLKNFDMSEYVRSLPDYQKALSEYSNGKSEKFDFVQPFIILEGMNFMENFLFKHLK